MSEHYTGITRDILTLIDKAVKENAKSVSVEAPCLRGYVRVTVEFSDD